MNATSERVFKNKTIFFAPIWTDNYNNFISLLKLDSRFCKLDKNDVPQYLLPYITKIYTSDELFMEFSIKKECYPKLNAIEEYKNKEIKPSVEEIRVVCFSTGCVFYEFHVVYEGCNLDEIEDFSYNFKKAIYGKEEFTLEKAILGLLPINYKEKPELFFTAYNDKRVCKVFHQIYIQDKKLLEEKELEKHLIHLRRAYNSGFLSPNDVGDYDMKYEPYSDDHWGGSQEGLVDIFHALDNEHQKEFLKKYKTMHLNNYRFIYLILLNQRFCAIRLLGKMSTFKRYSKKEMDELNKRNSILKTVFSFGIVSDDQLYQTIYSKMYSILGIEQLLSDISDNENSIETQLNSELLEKEKESGKWLTALSVLSIASFLIDGAGFLDRVGFSESFSSLVTFSILAVLIGWIIFNMFRHKK